MDNFNQNSILTGDIKPCSYEEFTPYVRCDYHDGKGRPSLPAIHFQWVEKHFIPLEGEVLEYVKTMWPDAITESGDETYCWAMEMSSRETDKVTIQHRWFMNFRRYGWCSTDAPDGKYGYGGGITYANGIHAGLTCETPEQVIRDTMVHSYATLGVPENMKDHTMVKPLLDALLADAIKNRSQHAMTPIRYEEESGSANGTIGAIIVNGETYTYKHKESK